MLQREYFIDYMGRKITAVITELDEGYHVLLTGGDRTHIGSVSSAGYDEDMDHQFPGHRDEVVSRMWADGLHKKTGAPVVVACGIHYDNVDRQQIDGIVDACRELLEDVKNIL